MPVAFKVIPPTLRAFPKEVGEREKGDFQRDSSHFGTGSFLINKRTLLLMKLLAHTLPHLVRIIPLQQNHNYRYIKTTQYQNTTKERGGHNKRNITLPTKYADFVINTPGRWVENKLKNGSGVAFKVISPTPRAFPEEVGESKKGDFWRDSSHFGTGSFLPNKSIHKNPHPQSLSIYFNANATKVSHTRRSFLLRWIEI